MGRNILRVTIEFTTDLRIMENLHKIYGIFSTAARHKGMRRGSLRSACVCVPSCVEMESILSNYDDPANVCTFNVIIKHNALRDHVCECFCLQITRIVWI